MATVSGPNRRSRAGCGGRLVELDREQDDIGRAQLRRVIAGIEPNLVLAIWPFDPQPAFPDRGEMRTACESADILPGFRQQTAEISADRPWRHHHDTHDAVSDSCSSGVAAGLALGREALPQLQASFVKP
jgi:hypothetical protein